MGAADRQRKPKCFTDRLNRFWAALPRDFPIVYRLMLRGAYLGGALSMAREKGSGVDPSEIEKLIAEIAETERAAKLFAVAGPTDRPDGERPINPGVDLSHD